MRKLFIFTLLLLTSCCNDDDNDCKPQELAQKNARRAYIEKISTTPELVSVTDNVKLYRIWTQERSYRLEDHWTYFTTPCGDVTAELSWEESHGKTHSTEHQLISTPGGGCK